MTGKMAAAHIRGIESTGTMSSLKHFALNNQEYKRFSSDSIVDERTIREIRKMADEKEEIMKVHYELAKRAAVESMVLLKNENDILPLHKEKERIVFIGHMAKECCYQGAGSNHINPWKLTGVLDA